MDCQWPVASLRVAAADAILPGVTKRSVANPQVVHYPTGVVKMKGFLLGGDMHGAWEWYRTDGSVMRTGEFDRGKQIGVWRTFDRSGRMVKETDFTKRG
jgi:antitoxin component YwqK of YwqJK toxin-antitoxin module